MKGIILHHFIVVKCILHISVIFVILYENAFHFISLKYQIAKNPGRFLPGSVILRR